LVYPTDDELATGCFFRAAWFQNLGRPVSSSKFFLEIIV